METTYTRKKPHSSSRRSARAGRRPSSATTLVKVCRGTLYNWKADNADFSATWDDAMATDADKLEHQLDGRERILFSRLG